MTLGFISSSLAKVNADVKTELDSLKSKYMVLMDYNSGEVLYSKNADKKIYPASTTKIWTAFCVLKKAKNLNEVVEIKDLPPIEGTSMSLENGEKFTVHELLESLLVHSSNDVAYVLAKHFGDGDAKKFIDFMNEEAKKYGARNTHFNNPHGLPDTEHYTTAMDMTTLSRVAYSNDEIKKIVAMKSVNFKANEVNKFERHLFNSNKFLTSSMSMDYKGKSIPIKYDIVDGIKTGFTDDAGNCLVSTAEKNGIRIISGVFFAPAGSLYHDSRTLLDYGFDNFKTVTILDKKDAEAERKVRFAKPGSIKYTLANDFSITTPKDKIVDKSSYTYKKVFDKLKMPVKKGDVIGTLNVYENGNMVSSIALIAENGSKNYFQYLLSLLPFNNDKSKNTENKSDNDSENKSDKEDSEKKNESASSNLNSAGNTVKTEVSNSFNGFIGIFSGIGDFFSSLFGGSKGDLEKSDFYKFLDKSISSKIKFIPSKVIIFGLPLLILIIILLLIISLIKDGFRKRKANKLKEKNKTNVANNKPINIDSSDIPMMNKKSEVTVDTPESVQPSNDETLK